MPDRFVLIVAHGRSGSTLLQGLLNGIDGWQIRGENRNFAWHLHRSISSLANAQGMGRAKQGLTTSPWYGAGTIDVESFRRQIGRLLRETVSGAVSAKPVTCAGFKEVVYFDLFRADQTGGDLTGFLEFLAEVFTPCQFVFLTRDPGETAQSGWWRDEDPVDLRADLAAFDAFCSGYAAAMPATAIHIRYIDLMQRNAAFEAMFNFLGARPDAGQSEKIFATPHSYPSAGQWRKDADGAQGTKAPARRRKVPPLRRGWLRLRRWLQRG